MKAPTTLLKIAAALALLAGSPVFAADSVSTPAIPRFENLGTHTRRVTTASSEAQAYFDQGLRFLFGFNHGAAIRSFQEAAHLDPACAMAHWGIALASGPHINFPAVPPPAAELAWRELNSPKNTLPPAPPWNRRSSPRSPRVMRIPSPRIAVRSTSPTPTPCAVSGKNSPATPTWGRFSPRR